MKRYNPKSIEKKWQKEWRDKGVYRTPETSDKKKWYVLDMFPYISGEGLHVGHPKGYIGTDVYSRYKRMQGFNVLHPMGWDAFGLPAENFAIKNKINPRIAVQKNIKRFKKQLSLIGLNYDWSREINTTDPNYYRWTQWIFLQLYKEGLAYESFEPINWCPSCKTGLANEDLEDGKCERCGSVVEKKPMRQWVLKITEYADRLLDDLDTLGWPEPVKEMQRNWIGRSEGAMIKFEIRNSKFEINSNEQNPKPFDSATLRSGNTLVPESVEGQPQSIEVFTTRPDTLFGATYLVLAPEHSAIGNWKLEIGNWNEVSEYINKVKNKSELERTDLSKEKTGVELKGLKAIGPATNEEIPIWIADYVLASYGTGAIMAVPAHDERDGEFAKKFNLPVKPVILKSEPHSRSFVMGISEDDLHYVGAIIDEKTDKGFFKIHIPHTKIENYKKMVRERMQNGFWNEYSTSHGFSFIFKHRDDRIEEFDLNDKTNDIIDRYGMTFNNENPKEKPENVYLWLSKNEFYKEILIHNETGTLINSEQFSGLDSEVAKQKITEWLEKNGHGKKAVTYRLKDWVFSRQRYWGEPIPLVRCKKCGVVPVPESELPVTLPKVRSYEPTGTGESPLANIKKWVNTKCPICGARAKRETNTMPQWAGSSWYYLRYIDPKNSEALIDKEKEHYWSPVDMYVGGTEHATRHLIYARFWHKFLYDLDVVSTSEPFMRLVNQGMILAVDGKKMSKRWGNIINPDDVIAQYGADTLRMYEMFMGPFEGAVAWSTESMVGVRRFLDRAWKIVLGKAKSHKIIKSESQKLKDNAEEILRQAQDDKKDEIRPLTHQTIKKITEDIEHFRFNTCVSQLMILVNDFEKEAPSNEEKHIFVKLLSPFAPHIAEELWHALGHEAFIINESWPSYDESKLLDETVTISVQFNGKFRGTISAPRGSGQEEMLKLIQADEKLKKYLTSEPKKLILVPDRLLNILF